MPGRRALDFDRIDAIMPDVEGLLRGHATAGRWTLGQICDHLARAITLTVRPRRRPIESPTPDQDTARRLFFESRTLPEDVPLPSRALEPEPEIDPRAAAESLRSALDRLVAHDGPLPSHPFLGPLTRDEWLAFHCIHCAHHLSFATPT